MSGTQRLSVNLSMAGHSDLAFIQQQARGAATVTSAVEDAVEFYAAYLRRRQNAEARLHGFRIEAIEFDPLNPEVALRRTEIERF